MDDSAPILSLPKDIQRLICEMLPLRVLARSQQVCTQWNKELLASLKRLTINDSRINGEIFSKIISKLSPVNFKHIKLRAEAFIWDLSPLTIITQLASIGVHCSPSLSTSAFVRAVSYLTSLRSIRLSRSLITPRQLLPAVVKHLPHLTEFVLAYVEDDVEAADLYPVTQLTNLTDLGLECYKAPLDDNFIRAVCSTLTKLDSLYLKDATCSESLWELSRLTMLTTLNVPHGYLTAQSPSILSTGIKDMEAMFSDDSLGALASRCTKLTYLSVVSPTSDDATNSSPEKLTDEALTSIARLHNLAYLNLKFPVSSEALTSLQQLTSLKYLHLSTGNTSNIIELLQRHMPQLQYVNNAFVMRDVDDADPYVKFAAQYQSEHKRPIKQLASFTDKPAFAASVGKYIWIQDREDLLTCKADVTHMMITNTNSFLLLCDELGQLATFSVSDDEFFNYAEPVSAKLTCIALSDDQRMVLAGTTEPSLKLLNTLGMDKYTVKLKHDDESAVEGPVLRVYIKADKHIGIGVVPHGIFCWKFDDIVTDTAYVLKTSRTITASAYIRDTDLVVLGDSDGLVTLSTSESIEHTDNFECGSPVLALSVHPLQPLIAIATKTDIITWCPVGGSFKVPHSSLPIDSATCTAIEWARSGGALFVGYSNGMVIKLVKCDKAEVVDYEPPVSREERLENCGNIIYYTAEKYLKSIGKEPMLAGKLTGMILELGLIDLEEIIKQESWIIDKVKEALEVLENNMHSRKMLTAWQEQDK